MRMFVAIVPPPAAVEDLAGFLAPRHELDSDLRWTDPGQWHLTLAFMKDVADRHLDDLVERLGRAAARRRPMGLRVAGAGAFPHPGAAKVLWAGVEPAPGGGPEVPRHQVGDLEELRRLATGVHAAAAKAGAQVDADRFHPHLTLARLRRPAQVSRWLRVLEGYRGPAWPATDLALIESHLGEGPHRRPRHDVIQTFALG
jgi:RNA 2',3'-cyclic 3'-phosphodiesterase